MRRLIAVPVLVLALAGCSEIEQRAQDAVSDAACSAARSALDGAGDQASQLADRIGADPQSAERELRSIRDGLSAALPAVDGELERDLTRARDAVGDLLTEAGDAARGEVDPAAVDEARDELQRSVDDVRDLC